MSVNKNIFLIGLGGAGKTTTGQILADHFGYNFLDLDQAFKNRYGCIDRFISLNGKEEYYKYNSFLFSNLLSEINQKTVFALSSGFLICNGNDEMIQNHVRLMNSSGVSILIQPSKSLEKTMGIIISRQLSRGLNLSEIKERRKIASRFEVYNKHGAIKIYSTDEPKKIVLYILTEMKRTDLI